MHGQVVPDPALLEGLTFDLAALENGGDVRACSDRFYSSPRNAISPGLSRVMGEGWETRRRRAPGNEWLVVGFAAPAMVSLAEIDTSGYIGNSPAMAALRGHVGGPWEADSSWAPLLPRTPLLPDTPHRFRVSPSSAYDVVRLDVYPDGGVARLRLHGSLTPEGLARCAAAGRKPRPNKLSFLVTPSQDAQSRLNPRYIAQNVMVSRWLRSPTLELAMSILAHS